MVNKIALFVKLAKSGLFKIINYSPGLIIDCEEMGEKLRNRTSVLVRYCSIDSQFIGIANGVAGFSTMQHTCKATDITPVLLSHQNHRHGRRNIPPPIMDVPERQRAFRYPEYLPIRAVQSDRYQRGG